MTKALRTAIVGCVAIAALALTGSALAAFESPTMAVQGPNNLRQQGEVVIVLNQRREDDAPFRVTIFVPQGYGFTIQTTAGTQLGTVAARAQANAISPEAVIELNGNIVAEPYSAAAFPQGAACAGTTAIDAVYVLVLQAAGQTLRIPVYVSRTTGGETAFAQGKMTACLSSPYRPVAQGGAQFGAKLITAALTFRTGFSAPQRAGAFRWRSVWTPYTVGSAAPNLGGTVETQAIDLPGTILPLRARQNPRTGRVTFSGVLGAGDIALTGIRVRVLRGRRAVATARTNRRGAYTTTVRLRRGTYVLRAQAQVPLFAVACAQQISPTIRCLRATVGGFTMTSATIRLRVR